MNIKLLIEYLGTNYGGWQKQKNSITIQEKIEECLLKIFREKISIVGSGRTDSGVHALEQVANFHVSDLNKINMVELKNKLNQNLVADIRIKSCTEVNKDFHSQHSCKQKTYLYRIKTLEPCNVFEEGRFWYINREIDIKSIKLISKNFIGKKDFKNFCKVGYAGNSTIRTIKKISVVRKENFIDIKITGEGFLRGMVRLMVGSFINYEKGMIKKADINNALKNRNKLKINLSVPACGLYLYNVEY
ncbi:MAG: tRNA pseudouridine(38-40) synthase TruA [Thermodesulfobacteriota bacteirum]|nr:tRNA pseudouridine(38-40) synthase TruA [Thermodesulfobacteriota bacterium]